LAGDPLKPDAVHSIIANPRNRLPSTAARPYARPRSRPGVAPLPGVPVWPSPEKISFVFDAVGAAVVLVVAFANVGFCAPQG